MRIAFVGIRGIPATYSGFETFVEQLSTRLAARGHYTAVYNRLHHIKYSEPTFRGVRVFRLPAIPTKHLDTFSHTFLSCFHILSQSYDIVYFCGIGNAPLCRFARIGGKKVILNVDAEDWKRGKWGRFASSYLRWCERVAHRSAHSLIADSRVIQERYRQELGADTQYISYGANVGRSRDDKAVRKFGLEPNQYILFIGRLVPENNAHLLIQAYQKLHLHQKLVIVGDAPYSTDYKESLRKMAGPNVIFTGYVFGEDYSSLSSHARLFVLPSRIDGTRPVLLDQMGFGNCALVSDSPGNMEVIGDSGDSFNGTVEDLKNKINLLLNDSELVTAYRERAAARVKQHYSWDVVADQYEKLFSSLIS